MLAKPVAVVTPLILAVIHRVYFQRSYRCTLRRLWPSSLLIAPIVLIARSVQGNYPDLATPLWTRPLIAGDALAFYLAKLVWPATLTHLYGRTPIRVLASSTVYWTWLFPLLAGLTLLAAARRRPLVLVGAAAFVLALLPVLGFLPFEFQIHSTVADHYLYLPMFGVALMVAGCLQPVSPISGLSAPSCTHGEGGEDGRAERTNAYLNDKDPLPGYREREAFFFSSLTGGVVLALILVGLAVRSSFQQRVWSDSVSLNSHAVAVTPQSLDAHGSLGEALLSAGRITDAIPQYLFITAREPRNATARLRLTQAYLSLQDFTAALPHALAAVQLTGQRNTYALLLLADVLTGLDRREEAKRALDLASRAEPGNREVQQRIDRLQAASTRPLP